MRFLAIFLCCNLISCASTVPVSSISTDTQRGRIYTNAVDLVSLPDRWEGSSKEDVLPVEKGEPAPISGILFPTCRAADVARLRIKYDELYDVARINEKFTVVVLNITDEQIQKAENEINELRNLNNSWWNRNKMTVGVIGGFVVGVSLSGLVVWGAFRLSK